MKHAGKWNLISKYFRHTVHLCIEKIFFYRIIWPLVSYLNFPKSPLVRFYDVEIGLQWTLNQYLFFSGQFFVHICKCSTLSSCWWNLLYFFFILIPQLNNLFSNTKYFRKLYDIFFFLNLDIYYVINCSLNNCSQTMFRSLWNFDIAQNLSEG